MNKFFSWIFFCSRKRKMLTFRGAACNLLIGMTFFLNSCSNFMKQSEVQPREKKESPSWGSPSSPTTLSPGPTAKSPSISSDLHPSPLPTSGAISPDLSTPAEPPVITPTPKMVFSSTEKVALILGPGGLRSFAHIGVLQEIQKLKVPINMVVGLEMGALVGALFSHKGQSFDVEWQMMKLKEENLISKSLLSSHSSPKSIKSLDPFFHSVFAQDKVEQMKIPFICPSFHIQKKQYNIINRGQIPQMLYYCVPSFPLFEPFGHNIAGLNRYSQLVSYLKGAGYNYLIYIDLISDNETPFTTNIHSETNVLWNWIGEQIKSQENLFDSIIRVPLQEYPINDYSHRREMIKKGQDAFRNQWQKIQKDLNL